MSDSVRVICLFCLFPIKLWIDEFLLIYLLDSVGLRVDVFMNFRGQLRSSRPVHSYNSNPISFENLKLLKTTVKFISHIWDNKNKESNNSYFNITKSNPDRVSRYARRNLIECVPWRNKKSWNEVSETISMSFPMSKPTLLPQNIFYCFHIKVLRCPSSKIISFFFTNAWLRRDSVEHRIVYNFLSSFVYLLCLQDTTASKHRVLLYLCKWWETKLPVSSISMM